MLKSMFSKKSQPDPAIPNGERVYAIGDVHGRLDCLDALIASIERDAAGRPAATTRLILLGDLVDRGPHSAQVVERCRHLVGNGGPATLVMGNHEEILLGAADGDRTALRLFASVGGRETLLSYGVPQALYDEASLDDVVELIGRYVPRADLDFLASGVDQVTVGDYLFVHAGIRPGVPLNEQKTEDLRWIRSRFLDWTKPHEMMVIHGHTIVDEVDIRPNRIGIDTGAYATGRLTAIGLEGTERWFLQT